MNKGQSSEPIGIKPISHAVVLAMCWLFVMLWSVWILPETIFIRNTALILGALCACYVISQNWRILFQKRAISIWLIITLLLWITIHLFFIGHDFESQFKEYRQVWKRVALGSLFAVGLGIGIGSQSNDSKKLKLYWNIVYFGLLCPILIYYFKWISTNYLPAYGFAIPKYLYLTGDHISHPFGISRAVYIFMFVPVMGVAIGGLLLNFKKNNLFCIENIIYAMTIVLTVLMVHLENDRWGSIFVLILLIVGLYSYLVQRKSIRIAAGISILTIIFISSLVIHQTIQKNDQWKTLLADARIAIQVDQFQYWKDTRKGYPNNSMGVPISDSNYVRLAIPLIGIYLLTHNPLGYGKLSDSMFHLAKERWPDSHISWTHSGFLDFSLGYGIIGFTLLILAVLISCINSNRIATPFKLLGTWLLITQAGVFLVKEVSMEVVISPLIFASILVGSLNLVKERNLTKPLLI
jgi:hypothetical protein